MNENTQSPLFTENGNLISRNDELEEFASRLPIDEFGMYADRIFNVWGEKKVGKTTFLETLRESPLMERKKVVWVSPKYENSIDNPQEFIAACSQGVRFPSNPQREESLEKKLEESQKGKVDPIRSDDSLLITRSSIATNKKPYVNAAAAASVGRTSFIKEDMDVSVGLGNNRAGNQAEAFLDALPLQSMGADLVVLHLSDPTTLSGSVRDWFRDYVVPAATKGPYRRNLVVIEESPEPFELQSPEHSWGEWDEHVVDFELRPASAESTIAFAQSKRLPREDARFVFVRSLGYPLTALQTIDDLKSKARQVAKKEEARKTLAGFSEEERVKLAICSLPDQIQAEELDAVVGEGNAQSTIQWLTSLPNVPLEPVNQNSGLSFPDEFRIAAISSIGQSPDFQSAEKRWLSYARLLQSVPDFSDRSLLYYISGLKWIDTDRYEELFESQAKRVSTFIEANEALFSKQKKYAHVSRRIKDDLIATATNLGHEGVRSVKLRAESLWEQRKKWLDERIEDLDKSLKVIQERLQVLQTKHSQVTILLKRFQSNGTPVPAAPAKGLENGKNGLYMGLLTTLAVPLAVIGFTQESPLNVLCFLGTFGALVACLALIPGYKLQRAAKEAVKRSKIKNSPEYLRKENADLIQQIQENETAFDELSREIAIAKEDLKYAYV